MTYVIPASERTDRQPPLPAASAVARTARSAPHYKLFSHHAEKTDSWNLTISAVRAIGGAGARQAADARSSAGTRSATESITVFAPAFNSDLRAASSRPARSDAVSARKAASESPTAFPDAATPTVKAPAAFPSATPASASSTLTTRDSGHTPNSTQAL